jgi:ureidoglycolate hydrolase
MRQLTAKPLTTEGFAKYGSYQNLLDTSDLAKKSLLPPFGFYPDIMTTEFGGAPTISVCHVKKSEKNVVSFMEAHAKTCECLLPVDGDVIIYVGAAFGPPEMWNTDRLEAFIVPKGTLVKLNALVIHGSQYPIDSDEVHLLCMLPARTFANDMLSTMIKEDEEKVELIV